MLRRLLYQLVIWGTLPALAWGTENFPPPEFSNGYVYPQVPNPAPRGEWFAYLDVAMLAVALLLAAYFTLKKRSRRDLLIVLVFSLLYFGFYRHGCICPVGAIQNIAMVIWQPGYALPLVVGLFFLLPLAVALFAGRIFCAGVCPLGAMQDLLLQRPVKIPAWLAQPLSLLPYLYLGAAVLFAATGSAFVICQYDPFVSFFRLAGPLTLWISGAAMLLLATVVGRPYCRFLCPYGVLLRWVAPLAKWRMAITPKACVQCHLCADACPFGAIKPPTAPEMTHGRTEGRRRLAWLLLLLPVLMALGGWLGYRASGRFARMHPIVTQADAAWALERGAGTTVAVDPDSPNAALYRQAVAIRRQFDRYSPIFGVWIGLVIGMKLILLSLRRRRRDYEIDQAACVACGRCYTACPVEQAQANAPVSVER